MASADSVARRSFLWLPVALGLACGALLVVVGGGSVTSIAFAVLAAAAGGYIGRQLARQQAAEIARLTRAAAQQVARIHDLCTHTLPVWRRQLDTSRRAADDEVATLTRIFARITEQLEKVMDSSDFVTAGSDDKREGVLHAIAQSGADLDGLVDALRQLQNSKVGMVRDIGAQAANLKEQASEVRAIAMQTRILTLNAAIEAAHLGAAGAAFAVIVGDMRQLAARTAETSEQMSKQTDNLSNAVESAFQENAESGSDGGTSIARAQDVIRGVVSSFEAMTNNLNSAIESMEKERGEVRGEISNALVALQFQDRVSQILSHVTRSMEVLNDRFAQHTLSDADIDTWLEELSRAYSTREEFDNLRDQRPRDQTEEAVTYF